MTSVTHSGQDRRRRTEGSNVRPNHARDKLSVSKNQYLVAHLVLYRNSTYRTSESPVKKTFVSKYRLPISPAPPKKVPTQPTRREKRKKNRGQGPQHAKLCRDVFLFHNFLSGNGWGG